MVPPYGHAIPLQVPTKLAQTLWIRHSWLEEHFHKVWADFLEPRRGITYQYGESIFKKRVSIYRGSVFCKFSTQNRPFLDQNRPLFWDRHFFIFLRKNDKIFTFRERDCF